MVLIQYLKKLPKKFVLSASGTSFAPKNGCLKRSGKLGLTTDWPVGQSDAQPQVHLASLYADERTTVQSNKYSELSRILSTQQLKLPCDIRANAAAMLGDDFSDAGNCPFPCVITL
jgi:hypothetical protein